MKRSAATGGKPRVQFVSKPMDPPFRDGSKCLVRDLCAELRNVQPHVLSTTTPVPELGDHVVAHAVYGQVGSYRPSFLQNAQAALFMGLLSRSELWHFVFAPNPLSSRVARTLQRARRVPTIQTIASPPKSFDDPRTLLFGDLVVAQSQWTQRRLLAAAKERGQTLPEIVEIPPPAPRLDRVSSAEEARVRSNLNIPKEAPVFVYPGDLEVSRGASRTVEWAIPLSVQVPGAKIVVAYRQKTPNTQQKAAELKRGTNPSVVLFACDVDNIFALLQTATAVIFPVEDLYGKVDLPIVLLEALTLGTPVLALDEGPLSSLKGALSIPLDPVAWIAQAARVHNDPHFRQSLSEQGQAAVQKWYARERIASLYDELYQRLLSRST